MFKELRYSLSLIYNKNKIAWLFLAYVTICLTFLTSEELWSFLNTLPYHLINEQIFIIYIALFLFFNLYIRYDALKEKIKDRLIIILNAFLSFIFDITSISFFGFITLITINITSTKIINTIKVLLLVSLPISLGVSSVSSITIKYLLERLDEIRKKLNENELKIKELEELKELRDKESEIRKKIKKEIEERDDMK